MIRHVRITTFTGSIYEIKHECGTWWLRADNVPNPESEALHPEQGWEIDMPAPWPPQHHQNLFINALRTLERNSPWRMPGGGKITSPVVDIIVLEADGL